jgi:hypothetical protein
MKFVGVGNNLGIMTYSSYNCPNNYIVLALLPKIPLFTSFAPFP